MPDGVDPVLYSFNFDLIDGQNRRPDYALLDDRIELLGDVVHDEYSGWFISTNTSVFVLQAYLAATLRPTDRYTLLPVPKTIGARLSPASVSWLKEHGVTVLPVMPAAVAFAEKFERELWIKKQRREALEAAARARHLVGTRVPLVPLRAVQPRLPSAAELGTIAGLVAAYTATQRASGR